MERRYVLLRVISFLFKLFAIVLLLVSLASLAFSLVHLLGRTGEAGWGQWVQAVGGLLGFVWAFVEFMVLYAIGEALNVLMAIEENTRASTMRLSHLVSLATRTTEGEGRT